MSSSSKDFKIIYCLISRGTKTVLTDFTHYSGNFQQITLKILEIVKKNSKGKIQYNENSTFYYEEKSGISFLCLVQGDLSSIKDEHFFSLLIDIEKAFRERYTLKEIFQSYSYQLNEFSRNIQPIVYFYEENKNFTKKEALINDEGEKVEIVEENIKNLINSNDYVDLDIKNNTQAKFFNNNYNNDTNDEKIEKQMSIKFKKIQEKNHRKIRNKIFLIILAFIALFILGFWYEKKNN